MAAAVGQGDGLVFQPDNVAGETGYLLAAQRNAGHQILGAGEGDAGVHQGFELLFVVLIAVQPAVAGEAGDLFVDQALFVVTVAQPFVDLVGIGGQRLQHIVAVEPFAVVGKGGIGFDQVAGAIGVDAVQAAGGQAAFVGQAVNLLWQRRPAAGGIGLFGADRLGMTGQLGAAALHGRDGRAEVVVGLPHRIHGSPALVEPDFALAGAPFAVAVERTGLGAAAGNKLFGGLPGRVVEGQAAAFLYLPAGQDKAVVVVPSAAFDLQIAADQDFGRFVFGNPLFDHRFGVVVAAQVFDCSAAEVLMPAVVEIQIQIFIRLAVVPVHAVGKERIRLADIAESGHAPAALDIGFGGKVRIEVIQLSGGNPAAAFGFDAGTAVGQGVGYADGLLLAVQCAANKQAAFAGDQGAFAVGNVAGADVQPFAGGDGGGLGLAVGAGFFAVVQFGGGKGDMVAVDAAAADVVEALLGAEVGLAVAVDQAAVGEGVGVEADAVAGKDAAGSGVVDVGGLQLHAFCAEQPVAVAEAAGGGEAEVAAGFDVVAAGQVVLLADGDIVPGGQGAAAGEVFGLDGGVVAGQNTALAVVDAQAVLAVVVNGDVLGGADLAAAVVEAT